MEKPRDVQKRPKYVLDGIINFLEENGAQTIDEIFYHVKNGIILYQEKTSYSKRSKILKILQMKRKKQ